MAAETVVENETDDVNPDPSSMVNVEDIQTVAKTAAALVQRALEQYDAATEQGCISIHSTTLLQIASEELEAMATNQVVEGSESAYRIAALLAGALAHDREVCPTVVGRHAIVQQVYDLMESATISDGFGPGFCEAHATAIRAVQAVQTSSRKRNYTPEQYCTIFEVIASRANAMRHLMMMAQADSDGDDTAHLVDAAEAIATSIGVMAEEASGCNIIGNANRWHYGPNFERSAEVQHG